MKKTFRTAMLLTACLSALSLTACGGSGSIATLTDSDTTTSIVGGNAAATESVQSGAVSATSTSSLPDIPAQIVTGSDASTVTPSADTTTGTDATTSTAVTATPTPTEAAVEEDEAEAAGEGNTATANTDDIRLRSEPSAESDSTIIGYVEIGETVTVLEAEGDWYYVEFEGQNGWVYAQYFD